METNGGEHAQGGGEPKPLEERIGRADERLLPNLVGHFLHFSLYHGGAGAFLRTAR